MPSKGICLDSQQQVPVQQGTEDRIDESTKGGHLIPPFFVPSRKWSCTLFCASFPHQLTDVVFHVMSQCLGDLLPPPWQDVLLCLPQWVIGMCSLCHNAPCDEECKLFWSWDFPIVSRSWDDRFHLNPLEDMRKRFPPRIAERGGGIG